MSVLPHIHVHVSFFLSLCLSTSTPAMQAKGSVSHTPEHTGHWIPVHIFYRSPQAFEIALGIFRAGTIPSWWESWRGCGRKQINGAATQYFPTGSPSTTHLTTPRPQCSHL